jgi:RimJ/RimL family protein N-acetyltransferase
MTLLFNIKRFIRAKKQRGILYAVTQIIKSLYRLITEKTYLYFISLSQLSDEKYDFPQNFTLLKINDFENISKEDLNPIINYLGDFSHTKKIFIKRFNKSAVLWIFKIDSQVVGYIWSSRGFYIGGDYFFPILENDVFSFDIAVFPEYRGKGIAPLFHDKYFYELKKEGVERIFGGVKNWNISSLNYINKTSFKKFGLAKKFSFLSRTITVWYKLV